MIQNFVPRQFLIVLLPHGLCRVSQTKFKVQKFGRQWKKDDLYLDKHNAY